MRLRFEDTNTEIYWMIPLTLRVDKYRRIMEKKEKASKPCDIIHIVKLDYSNTARCYVNIREDERTQIGFLADVIIT